MPIAADKYEPICKKYARIGRYYVEYQDLCQEAAMAIFNVDRKVEEGVLRFDSTEAYERYVVKAVNNRIVDLFCISVYGYSVSEMKQHKDNVFRPTIVKAQAEPIGDWDVRIKQSDLNMYSTVYAHEFWSRLNGEERELLRCLYQTRNIAEIARTLGIPHSRVRKRVYELQLKYLSYASGGDAA